MSHYYDAQERATLLALARQSLAEGLRAGHGAVVRVEDFSAKLRELRASFVTLHRAGALRGCIGTLDAFRPLVEDVADRAYAAGFRDPRFSAITPEELTEIDLEISVLTPPEAMAVATEAELIEQARPGVDGLLLHSSRYRGTLLPSVWGSIPGAVEFVAALCRKAGISAGSWPDELRVFRYTTEVMAELTPSR